MSRKEVPAPWLREKEAPETLQMVTLNFLLHRLADNLKDFVQVGVGKNYEEFLAKLAPKYKDYFTRGFEELLEDGCEPLTLASTVFYFYTDHPYSSRPDMTAFGFPPSRELQKHKKALVKAVETVQQLNTHYHILETLADEHGGLGLRPAEGELYEVEDERPREELITGLEWYITLLSHWQVPRKDIVSSCAPYYCCIYTEVATGHFQFSLVSQMLECLGYAPNPRIVASQKMRHRRAMAGKVSGGQLHEPETAEEGDTHAESLERNYRNFEATYPLVCRWLRRYLKESHDWESGPTSVPGPPYPSFIMPAGPLKPEKTSARR